MSRSLRGSFTLAILCLCECALGAPGRTQILYASDNKNVTLEIIPDSIAVTQFTGSSSVRVAYPFKADSGTIFFCENCIRRVSKAQDTLVRGMYLSEDAFLFTLLELNKIILFCADFKSKGEGHSDGIVDLYARTSINTFIVLAEQGKIISADEIQYDGNGFVAKVTVHVRQWKDAAFRETAFRTFAIPKRIQEPDKVAAFVTQKIFSSLIPKRPR